MPVGAKVNAVKKQCSSPAGAKGNLCQTMKRIWGAYLSLVLLAMSSCQQQVEHGGKTPLAQVGDHFLYREDMAQALPYGISGTDSVRFVNEFVQKWLEEQVLYEKAEHNVRGDEKIERMVAEYRRTLVMNNYEHMLLLQRMNEELSEEELQGYYNENKQLFILEEPVIKGVLIKVPLTSPGLKDLKRWYKEKTDEALEELEKYAFRNSVLYEYFYEHWVPVSELEGKIIVNLAELSGEFDKHRDIEVEDEEYCYLLHIDEYLLKGEEKPYDLARNEIINLLANKRKVEFMNNVKKDLYNQSMEMGRIKYYYDETK
jgi:hypothetical protein